MNRQNCNVTLRHFVDSTHDALARQAISLSASASKLLPFSSHSLETFTGDTFCPISTSHFLSRHSSATGADGARSSAVFAATSISVYRFSYSLTIFFSSSLKRSWSTID